MSGRSCPAGCRQRTDGAVCDACITEARAHAAGYAEGRAAERAAVVAWLRSGAAPFSRGALAMLLEQGAHVGAAKKGVSNV